MIDDNAITGFPCRHCGASQGTECADHVIHMSGREPPPEWRHRETTNHLAPIAAKLEAEGKEIERIMGLGMKAAKSAVSGRAVAALQEENFVTTIEHHTGDENCGECRPLHDRCVYHFFKPTAPAKMRPVATQTLEEMLKQWPVRAPEGEYHRIGSVCRVWSSGKWHLVTPETDPTHEQIVAFYKALTAPPEPAAPKYEADLHAIPGEPGPNLLDMGCGHIGIWSELAFDYVCSIDRCRHPEAYVDHSVAYDDASEEDLLCAPEDGW